MKVLHVIPGMNPKLGGVVQAVQTMIPGLAERGVHNEVTCLDDPDAPFLKTFPFKINAVGAGKGPWLYNRNLSPWLLNNISRFDAVVIHGLWQYHTHAVSEAIRKFRDRERGSLPSNSIPRLYVMPHGMLDPYFQRAKGRKIKAIRNWIFWKLIEGKVINGADGLLFTCEDECLLAREPFIPYSPKRELIIGLGVEDPPAYTPVMKESFLRNCGGLNNSPYFLFLSRIHEKKGVDLLIEAYSKLVSTSSFDIPKLVIVGPGMESDYGNRLKQIIAEKPGLHELIFFPGMLSGDAKWGAFYGCDAFVLPSHQENFGIAIVEALACGKPVLISNKVNIWREIDMGGGGLVAENSANGVFQLFDEWTKMNSAEIGKKSIAARKVYCDFFNANQAASRLLDAIIDNQ